MSFLNPLGFIAMIAVPFLIMLYFLKLKRPQQEVASTLLWQKVVEDMRVNSPFQRLKKSLLLLLQLLLLLALIFALTRPYLKGLGGTSSSLIVLVDTSASMNTVEPGGKSRLQLALDRLQGIVDGLEGGQEVMIIAFNNEARQVGTFTSNKRRLREAIGSITPTSRPTDIGPALTLADSLSMSRINPEVLILSDGSFPDPAIEVVTPTRFDLVGSDQPNLAITSLDIRRSIRRPEDVELFVAVQNYATEPLSATMSISLDGQLLDAKPVTIDGGKARTTVYDATLAQGGEFSVSFDVQDALADDNTAYQVVEPPQTRTILIVGNNTYFLKRVFSKSKEIIIRDIAATDYTPSAADGCSAVFWNMVEKPQIAPTHNLYIGCAPELPGLSLGESGKPIFQDQDHGHLANRFIDFSEVLIDSASVMSLPDQSHAIVTALYPELNKSAPLIAEIPHDDHLVMVIAFNPYYSNWPLQISYPIFLHNVLRRFDQYASSLLTRNIRVGDTIALKDPGAAPAIRRPDGQREELRGTATGAFSYAHVDIPGIYTILDGENARQSIAANLFNPTESNITINPEPKVGLQAVKTVDVVAQVDKEYTRYLLMAAAALLLLEWLIYHRRIFN